MEWLVCAADTVMSPTEQLASDGRIVAAVFLFLFSTITAMGVFVTRLVFSKDRMMRSLIDAEKEERKEAREVFVKTHEQLMQTQEKIKEALISLTMAIERSHTAKR